MKGEKDGQPPVVHGWRHNSCAACTVVSKNGRPIWKVVNIADFCGRRVTVCIKNLNFIVYSERILIGI